MVELADDEAPLDELVATLLFRTNPAGHSYRQLQALVRDLPAAERQALVAASLADRGPHDELLREHQSGYALKLDLLIDLGSYRDLHRHRRCVQIVQELTPAARLRRPGLDLRARPRCRWRRPGHRAGPARPLSSSAGEHSRGHH